MMNGRVIDTWARWASLREDHEIMARLSWSEYPLTAAYINRRVTGEGGRHWLEWIGKVFLGREMEGLSLACGSGGFERRLLQKRYAGRIYGVDLSPEALEIARARSRGLNANFGVMDLNRPRFAKGIYDFVLSIAALHHVANLEGCLCQVHRALKKGGLLVAWEFVGPDRFQWTDTQLAHINRLYSSLPERYKYNHMTGLVHKNIERRPLVDMIKADPSEAVRSSEIMGLVKMFFEAVSVHWIGGALLHPLLEGIIGNFDPDNPMDRSRVERLISEEERLMERGVLPSDFVVMVARKKPSEIPEEEAMATGESKLDIINRQQEQILELARRLEEAQLRNQELLGVAGAQVRELEKLERSRELLAAENLALKAQGPFRGLRFLRAKLKGLRLGRHSQVKTARKPSG